MRSHVHTISPRILQLLYKKIFLSRTTQSSRRNLLLDCRVGRPRTLISMSRHSPYGQASMSAWLIARANVCSCKHGTRLTAVSRKKISGPAVLQVRSFHCDQQPNISCTWFCFSYNILAGQTLFFILSRKLNRSLYILFIGSSLT